MAMGPLCEVGGVHDQLHGNTDTSIFQQAYRLLLWSGGGMGHGSSSNTILYLNNTALEMGDLIGIGTHDIWCDSEE